MTRHKRESSGIRSPHSNHHKYKPNPVLVHVTSIFLIVFRWSLVGRPRTDWESSDFLVLTYCISLTRHRIRVTSTNRTNPPKRLSGPSDQYINLNLSLSHCLLCGGESRARGQENSISSLHSYSPALCARPNMGVNSSICISFNLIDMIWHGATKLSCVVPGHHWLGPRSVMMIDPMTSVLYRRRNFGTD